MVNWSSILGIGTGIGLTVIIIVLVVGVIIGAYLFYRSQKKYQQFRCVIFERDGFGQQIMTRDVAGTFVDNKTDNKRLFLKKNRVGLNADNIPYITTEDGKKTIFLLRTGLKNFHYIKFNIQHPKVTLSVGEEDVNWALNDYQRAKKTFTESKWMQILPYATLGLVAIAILVLCLYFFQQFPVLKEVALAFRETAQSLAVNSGKNVTTVFVS